MYFEATPAAVAAVRDGMPVFYGRQRVGSVIYHQVEGAKEYVLVSTRGRSAMPGQPGIEINYQRPNHPYLLLWDNGKH